MTYLQTYYKTEIVPKLKKALSKGNTLAVPRLLAAVVNVGIRQSDLNEQFVKTVEKTLERICGQKPIPTKAKKSIAAFKIRKGLEIGKKVTLRGNRMYDFVHKLINVTLPRSRDFRGLPVGSIDAQGNLSIGFKEHIVFPEISADEIERLHGLEVTLVTNAQSREEAVMLFKELGFPFKD